jgi:hypothetical protein
MAEPPSAREQALEAALAPVSDLEIERALHELSRVDTTDDHQRREMTQKALIEARRRGADEGPRS